MSDPFANQSDAWIGRSIGDRQRYRLDRRVGAGGMGDVFLAMDTLLGKQVALKLLKDTLVTSLDLKKRFEREVAVSAALKSDHIVEVSDYGVTAEGFPFYVMEYLRGQSLGQLLRQQRQLSVERTVNIITQVCDGLALAHEGVTLWREKATIKEHIQVVHRDLKPDNIFLVPTVLGELVKILDFGIAKIREDRVEYTQLTNMFLGTFHYAAPEQIEVEKDIDGRADI
ncbi:MAG: serine/threonine-protein kinase, partial [Chroococcidiopsis sp.]